MIAANMTPLSLYIITVLVCFSILCLAAAIFLLAKAICRLSRVQEAGVPCVDSSVDVIQAPITPIITPNIINNIYSSSTTNHINTSTSINNTAVNNTYIHHQPESEILESPISINSDGGWYEHGKEDLQGKRKKRKKRKSRKKSSFIGEHSLQNTGGVPVLDDSPSNGVGAHLNFEGSSVQHSSNAREVAEELLTSHTDYAAGRDPVIPGYHNIVPYHWLSARRGMQSDTSHDQLQAREPHSYIAATGVGSEEPHIKQEEQNLDNSPSFVNTLSVGPKPSLSSVPTCTTPQARHLLERQVQNMDFKGQEDQPLHRPPGTRRLSFNLPSQISSQFTSPVPVSYIDMCKAPTSTSTAVQSTENFAVLRRRKPSLEVVDTKGKVGERISNNEVDMMPQKGDPEELAPGWGLLIGPSGAHEVASSSRASNGKPFPETISLRVFTPTPKPAHVERDLTQCSPSGSSPSNIGILKVPWSTSLDSSALVIHKIPADDAFFRMMMHSRGILNATTTDSSSSAVSNTMSTTTCRDSNLMIESNPSEYNPDRSSQTGLRQIFCINRSAVINRLVSIADHIMNENDLDPWLRNFKERHQHSTGKEQAIELVNFIDARGDIPEFILKLKKILRKYTDLNGSLV